MIVQDITVTFTETLRACLLDDGRVVVTDENGFRAMAFNYNRYKGEPDLDTAVQAAIVDAMLSASLPYSPCEDEIFQTEEDNND